MEDRQRLEQMMSEIQTYQQQGEFTQQQLEQIQASMTEVQILENTITEIEGEKDIETLAPLGAGSFISAKITNTETIIMPIGADLAVKKTIPEAKETLEIQKKELEEIHTRMTNNLKQITARINELTPQAESLMQQLQSQGQMPY